jgi:hypothetical protein
MTKTQKPDAPKFEPVTIAGIRPEVYALGTPEAEWKAMLAEDNGRIVLHQYLATLQRLEVLQDHLGLSGKLGEPGDLLMLLISVANKYVRGFEVKVGAAPKRGTKKVGDRFKTVTEVESAKILQDLSTIAAAIDAVAADKDRRPSIRPQELSTKYYACLREIEANKTAQELLNLWRHARQTLPATTNLPEFESLFWACERDYLGATLPHNVTPLKARKN